MPKARLYFDGDNTGIEKNARTYSLTQSVEDAIDSIPGVVDNTTSTSTTDALSANMGRDLQEQINNLASRGRFLSTWDCVTGLPDTQPQTNPYVYRAGDYYVVGNVGTTNYRPHGSEYTIGVASTDVETLNVAVNDLYIYDGTQWVRQGSSHGVSVAWGTIVGNIADQTDLQTEFYEKADKINVLEKDNTTSYTPTADYHPATKKYSDDNDTYIGTSAPTNNVVEGRLWYDTANDVLKVYNGSQWVPTGKTYTAGSHINISNADVISTTGLQEELTAGENITIGDGSVTESDMKGPCPSGFHVPTFAQLSSLIDIYTGLGQSGPTNFMRYYKMPNAYWRDSNGASPNYYYSDQGTYPSCQLDENGAIGTLTISVSPGGVSTTRYYKSKLGLPVRAFKNTPSIPDSSWTTLLDGSSIATGAGIFHNQTEGLISASSDGVNWITIMDKNIGATVVWNYGDTKVNDNIGCAFQWGNNHGFPFFGEITTDSNNVNASTYGPGNYYDSSTFITGGNNWDSSNNKNLWGGQTQGTWQDIIHNVISATDTTYTAGTGINIDANNEISNTGVISTNNTYDNIIYLSQSDYDNLSTKEANTLYCTPDTPDVPAVSDVAFDNTWDGVTTIAPSKNAVYDKINSDLNTKTFYLSSTNDLITAQAAYDWYNLGRNPIISYNNHTYILANTTSSRLTFKGGLTQQNQNSSSFTGQDVIYIDFSSDVVTSVSTDTAVIAGSYLRLGQNYTTPYIPTDDGEPTSKKYVDEHGPNIPVYYYNGDFNNDITFNIIEAGEYRLHVRAYHGTTVDKTLTLTVDAVTIGTITSNLIEHLNTSINFTASAGSTAVLSVSSKTNFTIQEVYIEKVNIQSGYLTATVN